MARRLRLRLTTAPARVSPGSEAYFLDKADGHLKSKDSAGVVVDHESSSGGGIDASKTALQQLAADATLEFSLDLPGAMIAQVYGPITTTMASNPLGESGVFVLPAGSNVNNAISTYVEATANPYNILPYLILTRLG